MQRPKRTAANAELQLRRADDERSTPLAGRSATATDLHTILGLPRQCLNLIPNRNRRECSSLSELTTNEVKGLYTFIERSLYSICELLLRQCPDPLYTSFKEDNCKGSLISGATVDSVKASKKGGIERRTLQDLLCCSFTMKTLEQLMRTGAPIDNSPNDTGLEEESESGDNDSNSEAADVIESDNENTGRINAE